MADVEAIFESDPKVDEVREWRQKQLEAVGVDEFSAFRLAMAFDIDLHKLVEHARKGLTGRQLTDLFLD